MGKKSHNKPAWKRGPIMAQMIDDDEAARPKTISAIREAKAATHRRRLVEGIDEASRGGLGRSKKRRLAKREKTIQKRDFVLYLKTVCEKVNQQKAAGNFEFDELRTGLQGVKAAVSENEIARNTRRRGLAPTLRRGASLQLAGVAQVAQLAEFKGNGLATLKEILEERKENASLNKTG